MVWNIKEGIQMVFLALTMTLWTYWRDSCWLSIIFVLASYWGYMQPCCVSLCQYSKRTNRMTRWCIVYMYILSLSLYIYIACKNPLFFHLLLPSHECVSGHEKKASGNNSRLYFPPASFSQFVKSDQLVVSWSPFLAPQPTPTVSDCFEDFAWSILL